MLETALRATFKLAPTGRFNTPLIMILHEGFLSAKFISTKFMDNLPLLAIAQSIEICGHVLSNILECDVGIMIMAKECKHFLIFFSPI